MAASVTGAIATVLAVALAAPLGLAFNGTFLPLVIGVLLMSAMALGLMMTMPKDKS
jgi:DHA1 family bicyclomycin/chloramphenicol resistance-like MFS transporter